jgi:hypothetical protein
MCSKQPSMPNDPTCKRRGEQHYHHGSVSLPIVAVVSSRCTRLVIVSPCTLYPILYPAIVVVTIPVLRPRLSSSFHLPSIPRAVAREAGGEWRVVRRVRFASLSRHCVCLQSLVTPSHHTQPPCKQGLAAVVVDGEVVGHGVVVTYNK